MLTSNVGQPLPSDREFPKANFRSFSLPLLHVYSQDSFLLIFFFLTPCCLFPIPLQKNWHSMIAPFSSQIPICLNWIFLHRLTEIHHVCHLTNGSESPHFPGGKSKSQRGWVICLSAYTHSWTFGLPAWGPFPPDNLTMASWCSSQVKPRSQDRNWDKEEEDTGSQALTPSSYL